MTAYLQTTFLGAYGGWFVANLALILLIALPVMLAVAMIIYADRKIWAAMALRRGPNVVGPFGLLQSFADGLKVALQETIIPSAANRGLFLLAPIITFTVALIVWAVVPFGQGMVLADINVGLLYILAASSLGVYGVIMAGWASNSKYPFYSALRAAAQMVSYEVSIGFILISVVLWSGSFNMSVIVEMQRHHLWITNGYGFNPLFFPMAVMFLISSLAETARAPFDLTEAESELVAGYQTEYSSMAFALYWLGEYANVILMCALNAILFWGGYLPPIDWAPLYAVPGILWLFAKILLFFFIFSWIKATVPRYRYDQLMRLGWKVFLPISLLWVVLVSGYLMVFRYGNTPLPKVEPTDASYAGDDREEYYCYLYMKGPSKEEFPLIISYRVPDPGPPTHGYRVRFEGYAGEAHDYETHTAETLDDLPYYTDDLSWRDASGRKFLMTFGWSSSWGVDGVPGRVTLTGSRTGKTLYGPCYMHPIDPEPKA